MTSNSTLCSPVNLRVASAPAATAASEAAINAAGLRMARTASIEVSVKSAHLVSDCARWLAPGTEIFISMLPGQAYDQTITAAAALKGAGFEPVAHVTARGINGQAMAHDVFARLAAAGVTRALVLGGDRVPVPGAYDSALALLESGAPARAGFRRIYVSGYPEGHPMIADAVLSEHLTRKLAWCHAHDIGAAVVTQFSFDEACVGAWLDRMAVQFPGTRVVAGVAGPAGAATLLRYAAVCGVRASMSLLTRHSGKLMRALAETGPEALVRSLARREVARGQAAGLHLFSFGGTERTARWCHAAAQTRADPR